MELCKLLYSHIVSGICGTDFILVDKHVKIVVCRRVIMSAELFPSIECLKVFEFDHCCQIYIVHWHK